VLSPFSKTAREFLYINNPIGKRAQKIRGRIQQIEKRNKSADTLTVFENSNEILKKDECPVKYFKKWIKY